MPDHVHILIWPEGNGHIVPSVLHSIKGKTGRQYRDHLISNTPEMFNKFSIQYRNKKKFRFWQPGGGYDRNLWNSKPIHYAIEYIENNPVRAGLVSTPEKWRWSSAWARKHKCGLIPDVFNIPIVMDY